MNNTHANSKTHEHIARSSNKTQATNTSKTKKKQIKAILDENTAKINITPRNRLRAHCSSLGTAGSSSFSKLYKNKKERPTRLRCLMTRQVESSGEIMRTIFARLAKQKQRTLQNKANQSNVSR
jgi:IS1 family transposase